MLYDYAHFACIVALGNVSIERLDAQSKICKKLLHSNDVARGGGTSNRYLKKYLMSVLQIAGYSKLSKKHAHSLLDNFGVI